MFIKHLLRICTFVSFILYVSCDSAISDELASLPFEHENYIIPITEGNLSIISGPREYYTLLILTSTDPNHGCDLCVNLETFIGRVSDSWYSDYRSSNFLFFVKVDIIDRSNAKIFDYLGAETVPHIWLIPPNSETNDEDEYAILREPHFIFRFPQAKVDEQVLEFAKFLSENLQKNILIRQNKQLENFLKTFIITFALIIFVKKKGPAFITKTTKNSVYKFLAITLILAFICGYQFTMMERIPFIARNDNNEILIISGGLHYQFGIEVLLVGLNYFTLASSFISLIYLGKYKVTESSKINKESTKFILICFNNLLHYFLYSSLTSIFLRKDHSYPYGLTKLF